MTVSFFQKIRNDFLLSWEGLFPGTQLIGNAKALVKRGDGMNGEETLIVIVESVLPKNNLVFLKYAYKTQDGVWKKNQELTATLTSLEKLVKRDKLLFMSNRQKSQYKGLTR